MKKRYLSKAISGAAAVTVTLLLAATHGTADTLKSGGEMLEVINQRISNITTSDLEEQLRQRPDTVLVDVRTAKRS